MLDPLSAARALWDGAAASFDDEPDHGLRDPAVRQAWAARLRGWLPAGPAVVLDIGCGTGSLSVLMAAMGHTVTGCDLSPAMIAQARAKAAAAGLAIDFQVMDAAAPSLAAAPFDALVCRHVLWALPRPAEVLRRWAALLRPGGRLVLVEGRWGTGAGIAPAEIISALPPEFDPQSVENLSGEAALWGRAVSDERYAIIADQRLPKNVMRG